jgi:hypothetical protein
MTPVTPRPFARRAVAATTALVALLLAAPSAAPAPNRGGGPLAGPTNLRVASTTPHSVTLAWDAAVNSGSFTYVIEASFGYRVGVSHLAWTGERAVTVLRLAAAACRQSTASATAHRRAPSPSPTRPAERSCSGT